MKKIMFDDRYGLTEAVLNGHKTMTRRLVPQALAKDIDKHPGGALIVPLACIPDGMSLDEFVEQWAASRPGEIRIVQVAEGERHKLEYISNWDIAKSKARYNVGEEVAVAQSYLNIHEEMMAGDYDDSIYDPFRWAVVDDKPGWNNKMFVRAFLMPHQIRITNVRIERLRNITEEDCLREGLEWSHGSYYIKYNGKLGSRLWLGETPREAFEALMVRMYGRKVLQDNPWVYVYSFELVC